MNGHSTKWLILSFYSTLVYKSWSSSSSTTHFLPLSPTHTCTRRVRCSTRSPGRSPGAAKTRGWLDRPLAEVKNKSRLVTKKFKFGKPCFEISDWLGSQRSPSASSSLLLFRSLATDGVRHTHSHTHPPPLLSCTHFPLSLSLSLSKCRTFRELF